MRRLGRFAALAAGITLVGGCAPANRPSAVATIVGGLTVTTLSGIGIDHLTSSEHSSDSPDPVGFAHDMFLISVLGATAALGLIAAGRGAHALIVDDYGPEPIMRPAPAAPAAIDIRIALPLPELACDAETFRLAQQARNLARAGHCNAVAVVVGQIRAGDATYADALTSSPALARCRR